MGGFNSGRWGGRPTIERTASIRLDVNQLVRALAGKANGALSVSGERGGEPFRILLVLDLPGGDGPWQTGTMRIVHDTIRHATGTETGKQDYTVALHASPCRFGGRRWWFTCPRAGRRCAKLLLPNGAFRFGSRQAFGLAYASQRQDGIGTGHARLARLHRKLGTEYEGRYSSIPSRPKGMHRRTYERLCEALEAEENRCDQAFNARVLPMLLRTGWTP